MTRKTSGRAPGFFAEALHYLKEHRRWWLVPMLLVFGVFGILFLLAEVAPVVSPFIYTLF